MANKNNSFVTKAKEWWKDVITLIKENTKIFIIVVVFIVAVVAAIIISSVLAKKSKTVEVVTAEESVTEEEYVIPTDPLEQDAYPEINDLMRTYYNAAAGGDIATINSIRTAMDDKEEIVIQKKAEYVQSYPVVTCYTKKGPIDDSFLVYVYYEVKVEGYEEQIPGLNVWYVCKNESGSYYINEDPQDSKVSEYCKIISVQDDVVDLSNTVNVKFNEVMGANEELASYMDELAVQMKVDVGEELAKAEAAAEPEQVEEETTTTSQPEESYKQVKATTVVNVRASDSENADKVGKAQEGQVFDLLEEKVNGCLRLISRARKHISRQSSLSQLELRLLKIQLRLMQ